MTTLFIIDTETGGIDPAKHSILSLAGALWEDTVIVDTISMMICEPVLFVDDEALAVNKLDLRDIRAYGVTPSAAVADLTAFLAKHSSVSAPATRVVVAGHNVGFDVGFLRRLYAIAGGDYETQFSHRTLDTASVIRFLTLAGVLPLSTASSDDAFNYFGITFEAGARHTALGDALATARLLNKLLDLFPGGAASRTSM